MTDNAVSNISVLQNKTNLVTLYLSMNQVQDISPLQNLINLKELTLDSNRVANITPLQNLVNLQELNLSKKSSDHRSDTLTEFIGVKMALGTLQSNNHDPAIDQ